MNQEQITRLENYLLNVAEVFSKTAATAEEVEALAAVVHALVEIHKC